MNATLLALLDTNFPDWVNVLIYSVSLVDNMAVFNLVYSYHEQRGLTSDWESIFDYARHHDDLLVPATGKHTPYRAPRM